MPLVISLRSASTPALPTLRYEARSSMSVSLEARHRGGFGCTAPYIVDSWVRHVVLGGRGCKLVVDGATLAGATCSGKEASAKKEHLTYL